MIKIMVADDEGIAVEALRFIIDKNMQEPYQIECAKTGRQVIEVAESFRPDIAFMDIQMPGINGVKAMQEIRKTNKDMIFIVISAYEKFDYAKDAITIGVQEYLNKPIQKDKVVEALYRAIDAVKKTQKKRADELEIQEKLETVLPVIETGMIYSILFQSDFADEIDNYANLLGIEETVGFMEVVRFGDTRQKGHLTNGIGSAVKNQKFYEQIRSILKEYTEGIVGPMMGNNVILFVPGGESGEEYESRIAFIDTMREMARSLKNAIGAEFRIGIGSIRSIREMEKSYREALEALSISDSTVAHVKDLPIGCRYEEDYPIDVERKLFACVENGDKTGVLEEGHRFFDWMVKQGADLEEDLRLKVLEFAMRAETIAYDGGGMTYRFSDRHTYLKEITEAKTHEELYQWFEGKLRQATENVNAKKKESAVDVIEKAKRYIEEHYRDVSLDNVSRDLNISPYYFSKLFKEKTGDNFIDYVTDFKIAKAKDMIMDNSKSMKEICVDIGYANPNYFSYIFKKKVGVTPSEYKEGKTS